ncbi:lipoprotein [Streptomyces bambusae]|nr:lipoprotein [Streptomyces bambusae]
MRTVTGVLMAGAVLPGLTACGPAQPESAASSGGPLDPKPSATAGAEGAKPAGSAKSVGGAGSPCRLPVTFTLAQDWKPKAITYDKDDRFASLFEQGGTTLACEIDAKPAGNIGFLRVWVADRPAASGDARTVLRSFMADEKPTGKPPVYTTVQAGPAGLHAAEVGYTTSPLDEPKQERAFAVVTPRGEAVVVHLGGLDTEEHQDMLPAYRLALQSLKPAG